MTEDFKALGRLFGAYLNQDFELIFGGADDAILEFINHSSRDELVSVLREIEQLRKNEVSERDMLDLVCRNLGCYYYYPSDWKDFVSWSEHLKGMIMKGISQY